MSDTRSRLREAWPEGGQVPYHDITHRDGVPWSDAPIPGPFHRKHWIQTSEWIGFDQWVTCACGARMNNMRRVWERRTRSWWRRTNGG